LHGLTLDEVRIEALRARPLSVPLLEPFVIASGRVDATRAVEVEAHVTWRGMSGRGLGEAACLPPVTREDQGDVLREIEGAAVLDVESLSGLGPVTRAAVETAILDAMGRIQGVPVRALLGDASVDALETDVTIAIADPVKMAALARAWVAKGFRSLKVKVGKDVDADARALEAIGRAAPAATLRVDANAGYTAAEAIALAGACEHLRVECWEQPCAATDLDGMAEVAETLDAPVIADESVKTLDDLQVLVHRRYADGVNLKLAKSGGLLACLAIGTAARAAGLKIMVGGMVETRLGMTAGTSPTGRTIVSPTCPASAYGGGRFNPGASCCRRRSASSSSSAHAPRPWRTPGGSSRREPSSRPRRTSRAGAARG
jgi:L-alanine-DL-glutamate epimerase-like enolase superfamily enzyme